MTLARWDPFNEMMSLRQAMDRLFEDAWIRPGRGVSGEGVYTPVDVAENEQEITVKMSVPGVKPDDLDISVTGNILSIKAENREEQEEQQKNWHRREIRYGRIQRTIELPTDVQSDQANADFENGILTLRLPKAEAAKPKTIKVKPSQQALGSGHQ